MSMRRIHAALLPVALAILLACRGEAPATEDDLGRLVDSLMPAVERATGLTFTSTPASAMRSREQVRAYLLAKLEQEFPDTRVRGVTSAYRLFGLIPDTLDLKALVLDLYTEQVAGYYDPDSLMLYGVEGADRTQARLVMAHELVHALQHQYLPLDSLIRLRDDADRLAAIQSVFEGHATLASLRVLVPGTDVSARPEFWEEYREQVRAQQSSMAVFSRAPLVLREGLIFPYLAGAEFMRWWTSAHPESSLPSPRELPASTEQVLFPSRYAAGDAPTPVRFADSTGTVLYEDTLGELEVQILLAVLKGQDRLVSTVPLGWGGDRYRLYDAPAGPALVWVSVWDSPAVASRFLRTLTEGFARSTRAGYRQVVESVMVDGMPTVRLVVAPTGWSRWSNLPAVRIPGGEP